MKKLIAIFAFLAIFVVFPEVILAGNPPSQANSTYSNPASSIPADGSTSGTITIALHDLGGSAVVGDVIHLSSDNGATFPQNDQTTTLSGSDGVATFTISSTTTGTDQITLTDNTNAATFSNWFSVTFYAATTPTPTPSDNCSSVPSAPTLSSVLSNTNNQATLSWGDVGDPVSNYLISYGISSGKYIYGAPNVGGQGTTSFTIRSLTGNKNYYFVVAATNRCGQGAFSNEKSVIVKPIPVTPAPTVEPMATSSVSATTVIDTLAPTDTPTPTDAPINLPASGNVGMNLKAIAIATLAAGIILIGGAYIFQKIKKKNSIPPFHGNNI